MLKNILPLSIIAIYLAVPAFADDTPDISSTDDGVGMCVEPVLGTYTGPANLQADWKGNEIDIRWYNNNTLIIPSDTASNGCIYGTTSGTGALTLPATAPTRVGYTFNGWTVRPQTNFANLGLSNGTERWGKGHVVNTTTPYCYHGVGSNSAEHVECNSDSHFTELNNDEWQTLYDANGKTLFGMAYCSGQSGDNHSATWPVANRTDWERTEFSDLENASGEKKYCWCKATGYKANSSAALQGPLSSLSWVFRNVYGSAANCASYCALYCAAGAQANSAFRVALFLGSGN